MVLPFFPRFTYPVAACFCDTYRKCNCASVFLSSNRQEEYTAEIACSLALFFCLPFSIDIATDKTKSPIFPRKKKATKEGRSKSYIPIIPKLESVLNLYRAFRASVGLHRNPAFIPPSPSPSPSHPNHQMDEFANAPVTLYWFSRYPCSA